MSQSTYIKVSGWIFGIIAACHIARLALGWEAIIGGFVLPLWLSVVAVLIAGYLAYQAMKL